MAKKLKKLCNLAKLQLMNLRYKCIKNIIDGKFIENSFPPYKGCLHDLNITKDILADKGVIIIDDMFLGSCRVFQAVNRFLRDNAILFDVQILNCFRGHALLKKK